jgi:hypothetical protein
MGRWGLAQSFGTRIDEYWSWVAVTLFLLISVDGLTTIFAARAVGSSAESNPLIRWALTEGIPTFVVINLAATVLLVLLFYGLLELVKVASGPPELVLSLVLEVFLGALIAGGLFVFANNLAVIVLRRGLL